MKREEIEQLRRDYTQRSLDENEVNPDPMLQFNKWFEEAVAIISDDPNAMMLSTVDANHKPHARIVLLKGVSEEGFHFYTNYESDKGKDLEQNPNVALNFYWPELERQIRIEGVAKKVSREQSERYFRSRPKKSQIGALASRQSSVIDSRLELEGKFNQLLKEIGDGEIPMPDWWGGFAVKPESIEFWQGRSGRLHDRIKYIRENNLWKVIRLSP